MQNLHCDWLVHGEREHFGSSKQILHNIEDFQRVLPPEPLARSSPPNSGTVVNTARQRVGKSKKIVPNTEYFHAVLHSTP